MDPLSAATSTNAVAPVKSHYVVLDGLRGIAAVTVVMLHLAEAYAHGRLGPRFLNHGYLAVDFFFMLSGFVIAYAYDGRWSRMSQWAFFKRRLIRLQPMAVMGSLIGAALFYLPQGSTYPLIAHASPLRLVGVMLLGCALLPLPVVLDIRGQDEMFPLNGPAWSLFFEYIANVLYALALRRLSNRALGVLALCAGLLLLKASVFSPHGDLIGGWSLTVWEMRIGFTRLLFPFVVGMLLMRCGMRLPTRYAFAVSGLLLFTAMALPRVGGLHHPRLNGLYEALCVAVLFPVVVAIGAGEKHAEGASIRVARFFGDLSYPLYITHYPLVYVYKAWISHRQIPPVQGAVAGAALFLVAALLAYACLKLYDEPVRRWLGGRFLTAKLQSGKRCRRPLLSGWNWLS